MKTSANTYNRVVRSMQGLTLVETVSVVACLGLLAWLCLSLQAPRKAKVRAQRINCLSNLRQVGLAMRMWANDHEGKLPWQVSCETNGTFEFAESPSVFRHFLAVSNEFVSPKVLACNSDAIATRESDWAKMNNSHLSYFVGLDSNEAFSETIISGDRNITGGLIASNGIMRFGTTSQAGWSQDMHRTGGNIGLADGSAQQVTPSGLQKQMQAALLSTNVSALRFSIPKPN